MSDNSEATEPQTIAGIIQRTEAAKNALDALLERLTEGQLHGTHDAEGWSVKDHVAHLAVWMNSLTALLRHEPRWQAMGLGDMSPANASIDAINAVLYDQSKDRAWPEVLERLNAGHRQVLNVLSGMDDADLFKPYSSYQPQEQRDDGDQPVINWVAGDTYQHYEEHTGWIRKLVEERS